MTDYEHQSLYDAVLMEDYQVAMEMIKEDPERVEVLLERMDGMEGLKECHLPIYNFLNV